MNKKPLKDICLVNMGQSPDSKTYNEDGNGLPFYQGNADFGEVYPKTRIWCSCPVKIANPGDILISVRAPIGALNIADKQCCIGRGLAAVSPNLEKCNRDYLYYVLQSCVDSLILQGTGSTFKAIGKNILEETMVPMYSIVQQREIVKKIACIDRAMTARKRQIRLLDQITRSRFLGMFGDPIDNPMKWPIKYLAEISL